jgi:anaerobic selenocysteine-containing dehydrogenase
MFYHPDRLNFPLRRVGEKGSNKWERITWDQAFDEITEKLLEIKRVYGPEAVANTAGTSRTYEELRFRFLNLFGSPNWIGVDQICHGNSAMIGMMMYGWFPYWMNVEKLENAQCFVLVGRNPPPTHQTIWEAFLDAKKRGAKLIVVDPRRTKSAANADLWLQIRPGTDAALLLSMIQVIIEEDLYDHEFVEKWCHGFEPLRKRVKEYPPEQATEITRIPAEQIRMAARMFATLKPSCITEGMGVSHQPNCLQAIMARHIISAIVGNVDIEGGEELMGPAPFITEDEIGLPDVLSMEQRQKQIGSDRFRLMSWKGYDLVKDNVKRVWGKGCDMEGYVSTVASPMGYRAMAYGDPYPIKGLITLASNPMVTLPNTRLVYQALKNLDLYVVSEYIMTPSALLADYVLPAASWLERPFLFNYHNTTPLIIAGEQALPEVVPGEYDRRNDFDFWRGLAIRVGQEEHWPWETVEAYYDYRLKPMGMSFRELVKIEKWFPPGEREFKKYEKTGFGTPTGKVELYSTVLESLDYDPLPRYIEPNVSPVSTPELAKEYPFILITGGRFLPYFHSEHRQVKSFRKSHPHPLVEINTETARKLEIKEGDWVWIETPKGRIIQKCKYDIDLQPDVVHAQHGWWFPEMPAEEPWLSGVWISNINVIIDDDPDWLDEALGSWPYRALLCKVYKAEKSSIPIPL